MIKTTVISLCFIALLAAPPVHAQVLAPDTSIAGLYELLAKVGAHPMVVAGEANVEAARRRIAQRSALPNPMLMLGVTNLPTNSFSFSEEPMTSKMIGISQQFMLPGKLSAEAAAAAQDTVTAHTQVSEQVNLLARDVKLAYFEIYHLERAIATNLTHVQALNDLIRLSQAKLTTGKATQADVLNLDLERSDIKNEIIEDETMVAMQRSELQKAAGVSPELVTVPNSLDLPLLRYSVEELDSIAQKNRPQLAGYQAQIAQQDIMYHRGELEKYPDFEVSLQYMQRDALAATSPMNPMNTAATASMGVKPEAMKQSDMISATISFDLPFNFNGRRTEMLGEVDAMRTMKRWEQRAAELDLRAEIAANVAKLNGIRKQYELLRDEVYPTARASVETSNINYTFDKTTIDQVIRNQLSLLHREHDKYRLEAEYNKTLAMLEYLTGTSLVEYRSQSNSK